MKDIPQKGKIQSRLMNIIHIIAGTSLLYLVQLMLPIRLKAKNDFALRAARAVKNLGESLPVFFALAVLSVFFKIEQNTWLALYWLISRVLFVMIYVSGIGIREKLKNGEKQQSQMIRSFVWALSIVFLVKMMINLIIAV